MIDRTIFKAYDIRGLYPQAVNEEAMKSVGKALADILNSGIVVIAHDGRHGSPTLAKAVADEILRSAAEFDKAFEITFVGLTTTPMYYFLVNHLKASGGAMITASHNPKEYNGVKAVKEGAIPMSGVELLETIDKHNR